MLVGAFVLATAAYIFLMMFTVGGLQPSELRDRLLQAAYDSFMHEGELIPGARPGRAARLTIRLLSRRPVAIPPPISLDALTAPSSAELAQRRS